jgi:putative membrane protein
MFSVSSALPEVSLNVRVRHMIYTASLAAILIIAGSSAYSQTTNGNNTIYGASNDPAATLGRAGQDQVFVQRGLEDGNAAVVFSKLALSKSSNGEVKTLAQKIVEKHLAMGGGLVQDAKSFGVAVPKGLNTRYSQQYQDLNKLSGGDFDKAYLAALLKLQHDDYENMQDESKASKVPHIQDETEKNLTILSQLDSDTEKLSKKLGNKK